jgi:hypothetical protein
MHCRMIMREKEMFYKSKLSLTPKRKVASYVGRLCEEGKEKTTFYAVLDPFLGKKKKIVPDS